MGLTGQVHKLANTSLSNPAGSPQISYTHLENTIPFRGVFASHGGDWGLTADSGFSWFFYGICGPGILFITANVSVISHESCANDGFIVS